MSNGCVGCGCLVIVVLTLAVIIIPESKPGPIPGQVEDNPTVEGMECPREEIKKRECEEREKRLDEFILREAPPMMKAYRNLQVEIQEQDKRIKALARTLQEFGRDPQTDKDYQEICDKCEELKRMLSTLRHKMEDVYLAAKKFEATSGEKDITELKKHALEDGIREAEAMEHKFEELKKLK